MPKILVLLTILLVFAACAAAQQDPTAPNPQAPTAQAPMAPGQRGQAPPTQDMPASPSQTIEGCLGGGGGNFTVTDNSGTIFQLQLPQGTDTDNLGKHVGEEVRVTGSMANGAGNHVHVSRMNKIADSCGAGASAKPNK